MSSICPQLECVKAEAQALCVCALIPTFLKELPPPHSLSEHDWHTDSQRRGLSVEYRLACVCDGHAHGQTQNKYTTLNHWWSKELKQTYVMCQCTIKPTIHSWVIYTSITCSCFWDNIDIVDNHRVIFKSRHNNQPSTVLNPNAKGQKLAWESLRIQWFWFQFFLTIPVP